MNMTDQGKTTRRQLLKGAAALSSLGALAALGGPTTAFAKNTNITIKGQKGHGFTLLL